MLCLRRDGPGGVYHRRRRPTGRYTLFIAAIIGGSVCMQPGRAAKQAWRRTFPGGVIGRRRAED